MKRSLLILIILLATVAIGGDDRQPAPVPPEPHAQPAAKAQEPAGPELSVPADAVLLAWDDAQQFPHETAYYFRYVWVQDANQLDRMAGNLAIHLVSNNSVVKRPTEIGAGYLLRLDVRHYAIFEKDRKRFLKTWEELRFDPFFNKLVTKDTIKVLELENGEPPTVAVVRNGETVHVRLDQLLEGEVARLPAKHLPAKTYLKLRVLLQTEAPVVSLPYVLTRMLTAVKDQGGSATVFSGLYVEFFGLEETPAKGTALDALLATIGTGDGIDVEAFFARVPSERRLAMWKSRVTGKPRRVDLLPAQTVITGAWVSITQDPADGNYSGLSHAMKSLVRLNAAAREVIWATPLELHGFGLYDGKGGLQREAPSPVVSAEIYRDRNGASCPHSARLQPAISCIECHWAKDDAEGFRPLRNDVLTLKQRRGVVPVDDVNLRKQDLYEVQQMLERLYQGDPRRGEVEELISRARADLSKAVLRVTGPWPGGRGDQTDVVRLAGAHLVKVYQRYSYEPIDARDALRELGVRPPDKLAEAAALFAQLVPAGRYETATLEALRAGDEVNRFDWSFEYAFAAERMQVVGPRR